jgi:hypothetical protein
MSITEKAVRANVSKLEKAIRKQYAGSFKADYAIETELLDSTMAQITITIKRFLAEENGQEGREYVMLRSEVIDLIEQVGGQYKLSFIGGQYGGSMIYALVKPGVVIHAESLFSTLVFELKYASNYKG